MFEIYDYRTGVSISHGKWESERVARFVLHTARENVARGYRTDIADQVDYWDIRPVQD
jgi:predicted phosphoadenosine phosphosulfate sulfurtransferase